MGSSLGQDYGSRNAIMESKNFSQSWEVGNSGVYSEDGRGWGEEEEGNSGEEAGAWGSEVSP